jgi:activator of HSP90 ATPase
MVTTIRQTAYFDATPHAVFEALLDAKKHSAFTGDTAKIDRTVGGRFSVFGGYATGKNERVEKDKVIAQTWRTTDFRPDEPDSKVMFHLSKKEGGTRLIFVQSNVPDRLAEELRQGWIDFYWTPLKAYLESSTASGAAGSSGSRRARSGGTSRRS